MPSFFQVIAVEFILWSSPCPSYWLHLVLGTGRHREWDTTCTIAQMWHRNPLETDVIQWTSRWLFAIGLQWTPAAKPQTAQATDLHWNSLGRGIGFRHRPVPNSADRPNDSSACITGRMGDGNMCTVSSPWASLGASMDLNKNPTNLGTFKNVLVNTPQGPPRVNNPRTLMNLKRQPPRRENILWEALVTTRGGGSKSTTAKAKFDTCRPYVSFIPRRTNMAAAGGVTVSRHDSKKIGFNLAPPGPEAGNLTVNENAWFEYNKSEQPIDSNVNRELLSDPGYYWARCGLQLNSAGCLKTEHGTIVILKRSECILNELESERTKARWQWTSLIPHPSSHSPRFNDEPFADPAQDMQIVTGIDRLGLGPFGLGVLTSERHGSKPRRATLDQGSLLCNNALQV
ncbi:hypothetical protein K438DRAFT_1778249 [Mycena galopus ATCC 62051]|nr:hypothetical protein K438DRAFT_1778249 [Mycena galopus ATCC 62051]